LRPRRRIEAVHRRRVLLVDMPQLLREIVRSVVAAEEDLELVAELADSRALQKAIPRHRPDFVIGNSKPHDIDRLLEQRPTMKVLQVDGGGRSSVLYELRPTRIPLGELSPTRLLEAIRA
jgi:DNA-binding NarL/FixJ family response regulator